MESEPSDSRRACEPCRKKKVRCPGGRPACAFCRRLDQPCSYARRANKASSRKSNDDAPQGANRDRIHVLESHIEQIYALLNDSGSGSLSGAPSATVHTVSPALTQSQHSPDNSDLPFQLHQQTINEAIDVYISQGHCSSLLWSSPTTLHNLTRSAPLPPILALVAFASRLTGELLSDQARRLCSLKARREILVAAAEDGLSLELVQALCLLVHDSIAESRTQTASDDIGFGIRRAIAAYRELSGAKSDEWLRAFWCFWALDRMFCSSFSMNTTFPMQAASPPYMASTLLSNYVQEDARLLAEVKQEGAIGIEAFVLLLLNVWAQAMDFARTVQSGDCKCPWSANSPYQKVISEIYDIEIRACDTFRLRHAKPSERSIAQLNFERQFWAKWFLMQILYHAIQVLINHPFLHIVRSPGDHTKRPPSFLQHTVDQTLLHASWIAKFIGLCEEKEFELKDPFISHLGAVAATALMFFIDSNDEQLASQATFGFDTCYAFVQKASMWWPHLRNTVQKLDVLQASRNQQPSTIGQPHSRSAQTTLLWSLLDYSSSTVPIPLRNMSSGVIELSARTQFLSPLDSVHSQRMSGASPREDQPLASIRPGTDGNADAVLNANPFDDLDIFNPDMFVDFQAPAFDNGFWTDFGL